MHATQPTRTREVPGQTPSCCLCSPVRRMLRFKTGDKLSPTAGGPVHSPYSLSPVGQDSPMGLVSPKLLHRKIARSPFKVRLVTAQRWAPSAAAG